MATAFQLPPELVLDIFTRAGGPPPSGGSYTAIEDHERFLERNRTLKAFSLVHSTWKSLAQVALQEEVYIWGTTNEMARDKKIEKISDLLIDSKVQGTKYLTVDGRLNKLMTEVGYSMWSQLSYLKLLTSGGNDFTTRMSDIARFPHLQELHLEQAYKQTHRLCFEPSNVHLRLPHLRRISFGRRITFVCLSAIDGEPNERDLAALIPITHKLFSPWNMPNLVHLAVTDNEEVLQRVRILLVNVLQQIKCLAIGRGLYQAAESFWEISTLQSVRHLSLDIRGESTSTLFNHNNGGWDLESLHLSGRMLEKEKNLVPRLIKTVKGEDPKSRIKRIMIYGSREDIESQYRDLVDDLDAIKWREDRRYLPFQDFDGR